MLHVSLLLWQWNLQCTPQAHYWNLWGYSWGFHSHGQLPSNNRCLCWKRFITFLSLAPLHPLMWHCHEALKVWSDISSFHCCYISVNEEAAISIAKLHGRRIVVPPSSMAHTAKKHFQVILAEAVCANVAVTKMISQFYCTLKITSFPWLLNCHISHT